MKSRCTNLHFTTTSFLSNPKTSMRKSLMPTSTSQTASKPKSRWSRSAMASCSTTCTSQTTSLKAASASSCASWWTDCYGSKSLASVTTTSSPRIFCWMNSSSSVLQTMVSRKHWKGHAPRWLRALACTPVQKWMKSVRTTLRRQTPSPWGWFYNCCSSGTHVSRMRTFAKTNTSTNWSRTNVSSHSWIK